MQIIEPPKFELGFALKAGETYRLRNGELATVLAINARCALPVVGLVHKSKYDKLRGWRPNGRAFCADRDSEALESDEDIVSFGSPLSGDAPPEDETARFLRLQRDIADNAAIVTVECCARGFVLAPFGFPAKWRYNLDDIEDEGFRDELNQAVEYLEIRGKLTRLEGTPRIVVLK